MIDVVALGELLIDFTMEGADAEGYPTMAAHPGGAPANFLAALAACGARTALLGKVSADTFGEMLIGTLRSRGIDVRGVRRTPEAFTTLAFVTLSPEGEREFSFARSPGADTMLRFEELLRELIDQARIFHFGSLSLTHEPARTATVRSVAYARERGKLITFDPNLRPPLWKDLAQAREQILWGLSQADVVKLSDEEVAFLFDTEPEAAAERILREHGVQLVFVTCGGGGCYYKNTLAAGHVPALRGIQAVDTTGAGDIFGGSAVWGILRRGKAPGELSREELEEIAAFACAAAGLSVTRRGGITSVPALEEIRAALG